MKVIIPLAGFGTRLRPHTFSKPKPLMNVAGTPVLGHVLAMFRDVEVEEFILITGYMGEQIEAYINAEFPDIEARFLEQKELNGQSPAVLLARDFVNGPLLIGFADTIVETDLTGMHAEACDAVAWVKQVQDPRRFGVAVRGEGGYVNRIIEKPDSVSNNLAVVGFYFLQDGARLMDAIEKQVGGHMQTKGEYYLADAMQILLDEGMRMRVQEVDIWEDCGKPESVLHTNKHLLQHGHDNSAAVVARDYVVMPPVNIHADAQIRDSVIGPFATIGADCHIDGSIIRDSIVDQGARITDAVLAQSLIGRGARVKGRFRTFNVGDESELGFE